MQRPWALWILLGGLATIASAQKVGDAEVRFSTANTHLREGRVDLAIEEFKNAIKQDGKNPYFHKGLGLAYLQKGRSITHKDQDRARKYYHDAIGILRKALELNPYFADVHNDLGSALLLAGKREEGKKELMTVYNDPMNPTPEISAYNLGEAYLEEKNYAEAVEWYRTSINRNKAYAQPYLGIADALQAQQRPEEATAQLENGVKVIPEDAALRLALGERYLNAGRFTDARIQLEAALRKDPGGPMGQRAATLLKDLPK